MDNFDKLRHRLTEITIDTHRTVSGILHSQASRPNSSGVELVRQHAVLAVDLSTALLDLLAMDIEAPLPETRIDALLEAMTKARMAWRLKHAAAEWDSKPHGYRVGWAHRAGIAGNLMSLAEQKWDMLAPTFREELANEMAGDD